MAATANVGDQIITKDGTVYQYYAQTQATDNTAVNVKAGWYDKSTYEATSLYEAQGHMKTTGQIAVEGSTWKRIGNGQGATAAVDTGKRAIDDQARSGGVTEFNIVKNIKDGEKSIYNINSSVADANSGDKNKVYAEHVKGSQIAAGDSITVSGEELTATKGAAASGDDVYDAKKFSEIAKSIGAMKGGQNVTVSNIDGSNSVKYTIAETADQEDSASNKYTRDHIIGLLQEGQRVDYKEASGDTWTTKKDTVAGIDAADDSKISATRAYTLMAEELQKASSIGADTEAKVTSNNDGSFDIKQGTVEYTDKLSFNLHVGADADMTNKINVDVNSMSAAYLGIKGINVNDDTGTAATYAIDAIADAVAKVSEQRSSLGAVQNRLEHTIANVDNVVENSNAAESRIRDTDMADEMVTYSKNNILAQAGQAMLAQANQATQGVLSILG
ncbi:flagellar hook protein (plasmid) [Pseudobutyrivibrio xylanivorans]|uniref:Flagellar hook protein n=2 Tax=Pseudobutyrivibrio xylanivorans TaxID=185007 RepID=A0A5P6VV07_PSEXY|nr:flagellar hook protein [Pseudobutyrivibrio xylanivorans]